MSRADAGGAPARGGSWAAVERTRGVVQGSDVANRGPGEGKLTAEDRAAAEAAAGAADDAVAGEGYGVAKARALLRMFREDTGRDAETARELAEWIIRRNH